MESFAIYIFKSAIWLTVFTSIYYLLLRNERFFFLNRVYLVTGLLVSLLFPLITIRYEVTIANITGAAQFEIPTITGVEPVANTSVSWQMLLLMLFITGVLYFIIRLTVQSFRIIRIIRKYDNETLGNIKVIKTDIFPASFSFFSYVFVSPSTPESEKREIVTHEIEHIRQHHWIDLILAELLCIIQWFNPMAWIYSHYIRQNHEYLADQMALQKTEDPAIYKAVLLNQLIGGEAIRLGHLFSYSLNKKRFTMMKNTTIPTVKKLKPLLIIPAMAIVFYAFAQPEYKYEQASQTTDFAKESNPIAVISEEGEKVKGVVVQENGTPLPGTSIIEVGTHKGSVADTKGHFELTDIEKSSELTFSYVGFKTVRVTSNTEKDMRIVMVPDTIVINDGIHVVGYGSNQEGVKEAVKKAEQDKKVAVNIKSGKNNNNKPLFILDGKEISEEELSKIAPESIESINVLKDASSIAKYGEKAADGVVEIFLKKNENQKNQTTKIEQDKPVFFVVEEMPQFPGGEEALMQYLASNIKYPKIAHENGIQGKVFVQFIIDETGKVTEPKILRGVDPSLDQEALRVISGMPDWKPGKQRNRNVKVNYTLPIYFSLQKEEKKEQSISIN